MLSDFFGLGHGGILIHISGQCASGTCNNLKASTTLTCVYAETASRASPVIPGIGEIVSEKFAAAICEAEAPSSANTALYPHSSLTLIVPQEHNSPFVVLEVCCKFYILQVTEVRRVREMDCVSVFLPTLDNFCRGFNLLFVPDASRQPFQLFPSFVRCGCGVRYSYSLLNRDRFV